MQQKGLDFGGEPVRPAKRRALTVTELTDRIQGVLETELFDVWVEGEISNLKMATSGHWYFSLKDDHAQVSAVVWRMAARLIRFQPKDGMRVLARGGVKVYAPRGAYQLSVEVLEPLGKGSLQQAFEELKERLGKEGLFAPGRKRALPRLPRRIGIVTSPTGAVIQDFLRILRRRYANLEVLLYPARVQGAEAASEIVQGIRALQGVPDLDVLIVARGGGSLEDLWPFNEEAVARALSASRIPTVSAVGHETDFTIADFVADLRAPTPSAAAELVVQAKQEIRAQIAERDRRLSGALVLQLARTRTRVQSLTSHRVFEAERGRLRRHAQRVDELVLRAENALQGRRERARERTERLRQRLADHAWDRMLAERHRRVDAHLHRLGDLARGRLGAARAALGRAAGALDSLSPLAVLSRGYALVWDGQGRLLRAPGEVKAGDPLTIRVHGGRLQAAVTATDEESA
jgi:exodeoxyribonuclease VII large subunit